MKLEEKIIKLRKRNAWSQEELAEKLDVTRQTVSKWELGQTTPDCFHGLLDLNLVGVGVDEESNLIRAIAQEGRFFGHHGPQENLRMIHGQPLISAAFQRVPRRLPEARAACASGSHTH